MNPFSEIWIKLQQFAYKKIAFENLGLQNGGHFVSDLCVNLASLTAWYVNDIKVESMV